MLTLSFVICSAALISGGLAETSGLKALTLWATVYLTDQHWVRDQTTRESSYGPGPVEILKPANPEPADLASPLLSADTTDGLLPTVPFSLCM